MPESLIKGWPWALRCWSYNGNKVLPSEDLYCISSPLFSFPPLIYSQLSAYCLIKAQKGFFERATWGWIHLQALCCKTHVCMLCVSSSMSWPGDYIFVKFSSSTEIKWVNWATSTNTELALVSSECNRTKHSTQHTNNKTTVYVRTY